MTYSDFDGFGVGDQFASVNEYGSVNYAEMNKGVTPVFFLATVPDQALSEESGRPRFTTQEQVRIMVAGDTLNVGVYPVTDEHRRRFADAYARFKDNKKERQIDGTPLSQWPAMTPIMIKEFEGLNVFSIEGLAAVSDANINRHLDGRVWRERAKAYLAAAKDSSVAEKFAAENQRLREKVEEMQREMIKMNTEIKTLIKLKEKAA